MNLKYKSEQILNIFRVVQFSVLLLVVCIITNPLNPVALKKKRGEGVYGLDIRTNPLNPAAMYIVQVICIVRKHSVPAQT